MITKDTIFHVVNDDGVTRLNLAGLVNCVVGGTDLDDVDVTLDAAEAEKLYEKRRNIMFVVRALKFLSVQEVAVIADKVGCTHDDWVKLTASLDERLR